jgi:hypothetical protein
MTDAGRSNKPTSGGPFSKQALGAAVVTAIAAPLANAAIQQAAKLPKAIADRRKRPRLRNEAIYRRLDKARVIGEGALAMDKDSPNDERQRMATEAATLRDALHEILVDFRLSSSAQKSNVLDAAQTAVRDVDRLVAELNKWALNSSDSSITRALKQAVEAVHTSENALLACMGKARPAK